MYVYRKKKGLFMQEKKLTAFDMVQKAKKHATDPDFILGNVDAKLDADMGMLCFMRGVLEEGGDPTIGLAFVSCCLNGFRQTAIEILRSGQVSLVEFCGADEFLECLKACSIPIDEVPEGLRLKLRRMQRSRQAFGM